MSGITLTASMRSNLQSLQLVSYQMDKTSERLSTGLKVNSAIDNASNYYAASSLSNRAADLSVLLDSMGQGIQIIKAANEGIETGLSLLAQLKSIGEQALLGSKKSGVSTNVPGANVVLEHNSEELAAQGYTVVTNNMTQDEIQVLLNTDGAKLVLAEDVSWGADTTLNVSGKNVTINGAGHKLASLLDVSGDGFRLENIVYDGNVFTAQARGEITNSVINGKINLADNFNLDNVKISIWDNGNWSIVGLYTSADHVGLSNVSIDIDVQDASYTKWLEACGGDVIAENVSVNIKAGADTTVWGTVIRSGATVRFDEIGLDVEGGKDVLGALVEKNGKIEGLKHKEEVSGFGTSYLYDGRGNTQAIVKQLGTSGLAAFAANEFYAPGVAKNDVNFGQGNWYLPSIGEFMDLYGTDTNQMVTGSSSSGACGNIKALVNLSLSTLKKIGADAEEFSDAAYWSSSEYNSNSSYVFFMSDGARANYDKSGIGYVRAFQYLEDCFNSSGISPKIGDVMYDDFSYGSADDYDPLSGKTAVGVVSWVSDDGKSAKVVNLKDLKFSTKNGEYNFDADSPYVGALRGTQWTTDDAKTENIEAISDCFYDKLFAAFSSKSRVSVSDFNNSFALELVDASIYCDQFNMALAQYDELIRDASYKGVNLLNGDELSLIFNENRTHHFTVHGWDISSSSIGLKEVSWNTISAVEETLGDVQNAISVLRNLSTEFGCNYQIVQTRQNFTEALIDVLETGADKLTLADMNEESAGYLMLETRQLLAINSLSLASTAAQSILSLF